MWRGFWGDHKIVFLDLSGSTWMCTLQLFIKLCIYSLRTFLNMYYTAQ